MRLRFDLLLFEADDGGLDVADLVLEQRLHFSPAEATAIHALADQPAEGALLLRLKRAMLLEGADAEALRHSAWQGRMRHPPRPPPDWPSAQGPWDLATDLPEFVAAPWRDPERWRRLAESRIAGSPLLRVEGFMRPEAARELVALTDTLEFARYDGMYARADCLQEDAQAPQIGEVMRTFSEGPLHTLISHVMGEDLPSRIFLRAWRLGPGDRMATHCDGLHYVTTFSLGLSEAWTAGAGGAIAFGTPGPAGLEATNRWLPHLGDLVLFRPTALLWHCVEEVRRGTRRTVTGHYVAPEYPG